CQKKSLKYYFSQKHPSTTDIYTLSLHDALPILHKRHIENKANIEKSDLKQVPIIYFHGFRGGDYTTRVMVKHATHDKGNPKKAIDRKSTRLNSSHVSISYAVFCLKKKTTSPNEN